MTSIARSVARSLELSRTAREWLIAALLAVCLVLLVQLPYLLAVMIPAPGLVFAGVIMNPEDSNSYLAKMEQGYEGEWLYHIPYTVEEHAPAFLGGFYIAWGHLARGLNLSVMQMWHLARIVCAMMLCLVTYGFICHFVADARTRWLAYAIALLTAGAGWLLFVAGQREWLGEMPTDFKMPEAHLFFALMTFPHFAAGAALIQLSFWLNIRSFETERWGFALASGITNLALGIVYPFLIYLIATVTLLYLVYLWLSSRQIPIRQGLHGTLALAVAAPLYLYYAGVLQTNAVMQAWDAQSITPSPHPLHYMVAYGALLALAAPTIRRKDLAFLWVWVIAVGLLVYAPLNPQRRFVEGVQVPLSVLAAVGVMTFYLPRLRGAALFQKLAARPNYSVQGLERLVLIGLVALLSISNVYILASTSATAAAEQPDPLFRTQAEVDAVDWMGNHVPPPAIVLSTYETGNFIPTRTPLKSVVGHWSETINFKSKYDNVRAFFGTSRDDAWRAQFLTAQGADYIFYGPRERLWGEYDPARNSHLTRIYQNDQVTLYQVK